MTISDMTTTEVVTLTEAALARVRRLLAERNLPDHALRVFVSGGGCRGMQYGMALESTPRVDDQRLAYGDVTVVIDPVSVGYLTGASIDYVDDLMGGGFKIENPNAKSTCGCGQSFKSKDGQSGTPESCCH
jgi:iron-sulfur cluster assembly protein